MAAPKGSLPFFIVVVLSVSIVVEGQTPRLSVPNPADICSAPYHVGIHMRADNTIPLTNISKATLMCSAAIISADLQWVLMDPFCAVSNFDNVINQMIIVAGDYRLDLTNEQGVPQQYRTPESIYFPPDLPYTNRAEFEAAIGTAGFSIYYENQVALVKLASAFSPSACVSSVSLPTNADKDCELVNCRLTTWNPNANFGLEGTNVLHSAPFEMYSESVCRTLVALNKLEGWATTTCGDGPAQTCLQVDDSGSPVICESNGRRFLRGASLLHQCLSTEAGPPYPQLFVDAIPFVSWIQNTMASN